MGWRSGPSGFACTTLRSRADGEGVGPTVSLLANEQRPGGGERLFDSGSSGASPSAFEPGHRSCPDEARPGTILRDSHHSCSLEPAEATSPQPALCSAAWSSRQNSSGVWVRYKTIGCRALANG